MRDGTAGEGGGTVVLRARTPRRGERTAVLGGNRQVVSRQLVSCGGENTKKGLRRHRAGGRRRVAFRRSRYIEGKSTPEGSHNVVCWMTNILEIAFRERKRCDGTENLRIFQLIALGLAPPDQRGP